MLIDVVLPDRLTLFVVLAVADALAWAGATRGGATVSPSGRTPG